MPTHAEWSAVVHHQEQAWQQHHAACAACQDRGYNSHGGCSIGKQIKQATDQAHAGYRVYLQTHQEG